VKTPFEKLALPLAPTGPTSVSFHPAGSEVTVNVALLDASPPTVTTKGPVEALVGTAAVMDVALQETGVTVVPLYEMVLVPCVAPKFAPTIVT
jgi:hypothetical protein